MKRLLKIVLVTFAALLALAIVALAIVYFYLGSIVKTGIETIGPKLTKCPMTVAAVHIAPLRGRIEIVGFNIGNPEGFKTPSAIKLGTVRVLVEMKSLLSDCIVVDEVFIDTPEITYEKSLTNSNIATLQKNIETMTGAGAAGQPAPPAVKPGRTVKIHLVTIHHGQVNASVTGLGGQALLIPLPEIVMAGIGEHGTDVTLAQAVGEILQGLLMSVADAVLNNPDALKKGAEAAGSKIQNGASGLLKGAKGLFSK